MNSEGVSGGSEVDAMVVLVVLWIGTKRKGVALYRLKKEGEIVKDFKGCLKMDLDSSIMYFAQSDVNRRPITAKPEPG